MRSRRAVGSFRVVRSGHAVVPACLTGPLTELPRPSFRKTAPENDPSDWPALEAAVFRAESRDSESVFGAPDADPEAHM